jgi:fibronectin-binding autotransporter adhesin
MKTPLSRSCFLKRRFFGIVAGLSLVGVAINLQAQTTYTYTGASSSAWLTTGNWTGNSGHYPGTTTANNPGAGASSDIADFGSAVTSSTNGVGISFNNAEGGLVLGTIDAISGLSKTVTIGDSSNSTAGTLTLTGNILNSIPNTIISNESSSSLTLAPIQGSGSSSMSIALGASSNVIQVNSSGSITISSNITDGSSASALTIAGSGSGSVTLSGTNTFSGGITVNQGILNANTNSSSSVELGTGSVTVNPTGTTGTSADAATANISGSAIYNGSAVTVNTNSATEIGTVYFNTGTPTIGSLSGTGSVVLQNSNGTQLTIGYTNNLNSTFSGSISEATSGEGSVVKAGTGTLILTGTNTYTGTTTINGGTLELDNGSGAALSGTSTVVITKSGTLLMGAARQFSATSPAAVILNGSSSKTAIFSVNGFSQGSTSANGVGALTLTSGSANNIIDFNSKNGTVTFASFTPNGAVLTINNYIGNGSSGSSENESGNYNNFNFGFGNGVGVTQAQVSPGFYEVYDTDVPEPATIFGGVLMVASLGYSQRRRIGGWMTAAQTRRTVLPT